ncbi:MAG: polysaccharide deacetylase family protein [Drouetiella hepatica Uher 2000/2452]|uniref:Polysaccharide deacetylase family protein n=1 Tax=Drouetiella hepatica Uher 2000/2452 TaxID=904376 RepID=A0A951Q939_9CYAN|nr:polysaccharide deacetylase family protein [Drouetiella hepatica Uher 2000/2452]
MHRHQRRRKLSLTVAIVLFISSFLLLMLLFSYWVTPRIPIIGFHGIIDLTHPALGAILNPTAQRMTYPMQDLEKLLEYLVRSHYWFLSAQEMQDFFIEKSQSIPADHKSQKPVMVTFDDSYKTVYTNVIPILERLEKQYGHKAKMVLFINPGTLAKPNHPSTLYLSCKDLQSGYEKGYYDIQSHGQNHKNLTKISDRELLEELVQAQTQLRSCMAGLAPEKAIAAHLAYPYGSMNNHVASVASKYYHSGYLYNSRILRFCWLKDHYRISRLTTNRNKSVDRLIQVVDQAMEIKRDQPCSR